MKLLLIAACAIAGETVVEHADLGDVIDVSKDEAASLTRMGRALYLEKSDDPTKGTLTADADAKEKAKKQAAAIKAEAKARAEAAELQSPAGMAALVAASVAQAVQAALQPAAATAKA